MSDLPLLVLLAIFVVAATAIWLAGVQLSEQTDVLSTRLHLGAALGGLILLAIATNLPRSRSSQARRCRATSASPSATSWVVSPSRRSCSSRWTPSASKAAHPLTYRAASLVLVLEGALVVAVLTVVVAGSQLPADLIVVANRLPRRC